MATQGSISTRKHGRTFITDHLGQKQVLCHICWHRKPRSSYYDTCYKGIGCTPLRPWSENYDVSKRVRTGAVGPNGASPMSELEAQTATSQQLLSGVGNPGLGNDAMESEPVHKEETFGEGNVEDSAAQDARGDLLAGMYPLGEGSVEGQPKAEAQAPQGQEFGVEEVDFGVPECLGTEEELSRESKGEDLSSDERSTMSSDHEDEGEESTEMHQLAMDMLHKFHELGDDAACDGYVFDENEDQERADNIEAAAAYLCKRLKQGSLEGMEDEEGDEGDDWGYEQQQMDGEVSSFEGRIHSQGCDVLAKQSV